MGKLGWKIRFNRFISSFPFTTGILPPFFHVERKGKKGERKSSTRVETEKRIDDIHTHIYIHGNYIFEWNESKTDLKRYEVLSTQRKQIVCQINIWFVATILRIFLPTTVSNGGVIQFPSRLCIRRYLFLYVINSKASRHATRSHFCANRLDETTRHERETRD